MTMKLEMNSTNRLIVAMLALAVLAGVLWTQLLSPKREEAKELETKVGQVRASLQQHEAEVVEAEAARAEFPAQYRRLVVLGKAVPGDDDVASLLVQLNRISDSAGAKFKEFQLNASGGEETVAAPPAGSAEAPASPTEVAASLMPLGAAIGPAGLAVMPYEVSFDGDFFEIANFIKGLDKLVNTRDRGEQVVVDGRLLTVDGFALEADPEVGFPKLKATFSLTSYLTPPSEGITGGATPTAPATETATPAATTTGGAQ
jgi:Tfp pilus assembly protein PilO